jgi:hypothetical protein
VTPTTDRPTTRPPAPPPARPAWSGGEPPPEAPGRRPVVAGTVLVVVGALWLLQVLGVRIAWEVLLPVAVIVVGLAVLVGGRSKLAAGLVPLGVVLAVLAGIAVLLPGTASLETGQRSLVVADLADLDESYSLGAGQLTLDLRELELPEGTTPLRISVGLGELRVQVPADATVVVDGRVGAGELVAFGTRVDGLGPRRELTETGTDGAGTLRIEARVGLGTMEVTR